MEKVPEGRIEDIDLARQMASYTYMWEIGSRIMAGELRQHGLTQNDQDSLGDCAKWIEQVCNARLQMALTDYRLGLDVSENLHLPDLLELKRRGVWDGIPPAREVYLDHDPLPMRLYPDPCADAASNSPHP